MAESDAEFISAEFSSAEFINYAGLLAFPRSPHDLTDTTLCPACLNRLTGSVCGICQLDLNHPAASELFRLSTDAAAALDRRGALIGRIRYETAQLIEQQAAARADALARSAPGAAQAFAGLKPTIGADPSPTAASPAGASSGVASTAGPSAGNGAGNGATALATGIPADPTTRPETEPATTRRSSVQVILLIVGVSLLSIAAIFFLVFAFITYGLLARSIIIGSITLAAFVAASLLRRRGLRATAESIAVFAVVLVYLDAFAVRANDLAGLGDANGALYWGTALTGSALAFMLWHRRSTLRAPSIAGFAAFVPGVGLLAGGLSDSFPTETQYFAAFLAAGAAGLIQLVGSPREPGAARTATTERVIALSMAVIALACAFFVAFAVQPGRGWAPAVALAIVGIVALTHVLVIGGTNSPSGIRALGLVVAGLGGVALATIGVAVAVRIAGSAVDAGAAVNAALFWPAVVAATVALALEAVSRRTADHTMVRPARVAALSAAAVAAVAVMIPVCGALFTALTAAGSGYLSPWSGLATDAAVDRGSWPLVAVAALAVVTLLLAVFWAVSGVLRKRSAILAWPAAALVALAMPLTGIVWATVVGWLFLAAAGTLLLVLSRERMPIRRAFRLPIAVGSTASLALGYSASWISIDTWGWASLASVVILLAGRTAFGPARLAASPSTRPGRAVRALLLGAAIAVALVGAAALARQLGDAGEWESWIDALRFVGILATLLVAAAATAPAGFASTVDRRVAYWIATPVALAATLASASAVGTASRRSLDALLLPEFGTSLILGVALLAALLLWAVPRSDAALRSERIVASIAVAPTVYWIVDSFTRVVGLPDYARMTAPLVAALLVAAGSLTATPLHAAARTSAAPAPSVPRWARETSIAIVAAPAVLVAVATDQDATWLVLLLSGVTALILAISGDGLFTSASRRKHLGWLAILLATAGLWWRLSGERVSALEFYVVPVSVVLLLVAVLIRRATDRATAAGAHGASASRAAPFVVLGGLLVSILPLAVDATTGDVVRGFVIGAVSALVLLGGAFAPHGRAFGPYLDAAAFAGALGVLITGAGRGVFLAWEPGGSNDARLDIWLAAAFLLLVLAAAGLAANGAADDTALRTAPGTAPGPASRRSSAAQALVVFAMAPVLVLEGAGLGSDSLGPIRALAVTVLFSLLYLAGSLWRHPPLTPLIGWIALGCAAAIALAGISAGALEPIETGTVPIAIVLVVAGAIRLARNPRTRSWPQLGPGIIVLLLPSLIAPALDAGADRPLWRLVGLGVLAVATLVVGVLRRLQAPFVLGAVVVLIHAAATFSSEIRVVYQAVPGYYWLAAGGVLLIVLAARYEKRIKNFKDAALAVAALR